ncbi:hypothetical protein ACNKHO_22330 [Shigella flexneri]
MKAVGRTGAVALLYFEVVTTIALMMACYCQRGSAWCRHERRSGNSGCESGRVYADRQRLGIVAFLLDVIPSSVIGALPAGTSAGAAVCGDVRLCAASSG